MTINEKTTLGFLVIVTLLVVGTHTIGWNGFLVDEPDDQEETCKKYVSENGGFGTPGCEEHEYETVYCEDLNNDSMIHIPPECGQALEEETQGDEQ